MKYIVLFLGCYMFLTIILLGITQIIDSEFVQDLASIFWWALPFIFLLGILIMIFLL